MVLITLILILFDFNPSLPIGSEGLFFTVLFNFPTHENFNDVCLLII